MDRAKRDAAFAARVRAGQSDRGGRSVGLSIDALAAERGLTFEIGVLRLAYDRVTDVEVMSGDPRRAAAVLRRLTSSLVRATRLQRTLEADGHDVASDALTALLLEVQA